MKRNYLLIFFLFVFLSPSVQADWIYLKNGNKVQGQILEDRESWIKVQVSRGVLRFEKSQILKIEKEKESKYLLEKARHLRRLMATDEALDHLKALVKKDSQSEEAKEELRKTYINIIDEALGKKQLYKAAHYVQDALKILPQDTRMVEQENRISELYHTLLQLGVKARELYQKKNFPGALVLYLKIIDHLPSKVKELALPVSSCYFNIGQDLFNKKAYLPAFNHFEKALSFHPPSAPQLEIYLVYSIMGEASKLFSKKEFQKAEKILYRGLHYAPNNRKIQFYLAHCYYSQGKIQKSLEEYYRVLGRSVPTGEINLADLQKQAAQVAQIKLLNGREEDQKARQVLPGEWRTITTAHFVIYHRNDYVGQKAASVVEYYFEQIKKDLPVSQATLATPCEVYLYSSQEEYERASGLPSWNPGVTRLRKRGYTVKLQILSYQTAPSLYQAILSHEIGHVMLLRAQHYKSSPRWLSEGVAVSMEYGYKKYYYRRIVKASLAAKGLPPLKDLLLITRYPTSQTENMFFYAYSYTLVDFLLKQGRWSKLMEIARKLSYLSPEKALLEVYGFSSLEEAERMWKGHIEEY